MGPAARRHLQAKSKASSWVLAQYSARDKQSGSVVKTGERERERESERERERINPLLN